MDFGVVFQTDPPAWELVDMAAEAEGFGFNHAYTFDSHVLWQEPFVIFSQILSATKEMKVGPMVTNPGTRDWTVLASCFATLNDMFGERTVCAIGRGDSALRVIGRTPVKLATLKEAMKVVKDLVEGRETEYRGTTQKFPWRDSGQLDIWMAGYGPKALKLCGEVADGFVLQLADLDIAKWTIEEVKTAADNAGRNPDDLTICIVAPAYIGEDIEHQRDQCRWFGGMVGNHVADLVERYGDSGSNIPQVLTEYIKGRKGYDYAEHGRADNEHTTFVPDEIVDRFCILGTAEEHIEKIRSLQELGMDQFAVYLMHDKKRETLAAYGKEIIPVFNK